MSLSGWKRILCSRKQLRIEITLACGQSFRWHETRPNEWTSVLADRVFTLSQTDSHLLYKVHGTDCGDWEEIPLLHADNADLAGVPHLQTENRRLAGVPRSTKRKNASFAAKNPQKKPRGGATSGRGGGDQKDGVGAARRGDDDGSENILRDYFQLDIDVERLYERWSDADENFARVAPRFIGVRMLRQDPVENLFSFICSSNNNIARIAGMVERMCTRYGEPLPVVGGATYHAFPGVAALAADGVEGELRALGFGYRAKYVAASARWIAANGGEAWLRGLRGVPYARAHAELTKLTGVGAKVADCVCLMSLDKTGAIPVDTHVWQIASRDYMPHLKKVKSVNDKVYKEIGEFFRDLFGPYAGWAHSVLFSADLKKFEDASKPKQQPSGRPPITEAN
ncbi:PREDICTED: N-glycosylase/DNA lyase-like isoform X1 [Priapulus caudatus]|uniref:DNA-(apurinic or apyrimidinic site) lyase n=1 Tax=Priapulus caudatus TaxID=37621 RepID=A0ABM1EQ33_PRICU|nr:PREDICTED: N-glycosylase/DNA lyase-like isoform X1 [Priapulus caudatus]